MSVAKMSSVYYSHCNPSSKKFSLCSFSSCILGSVPSLVSLERWRNQRSHVGSIVPSSTACSGSKFNRRFTASMSGKYRESFLLCRRYRRFRSRAGNAQPLSTCVDYKQGALDQKRTDPPGSRQRRQLVRVVAWVILLSALSCGSALSAEEKDQSSAPTGLIQRLLERSKANKAKHDKERLDDYYRRNYRDYFEFVKGTIKDKPKDQLTKAETNILDWLETNK